MNFQGSGGYPLSVFIITSVLGDFTDIDFRVKVRSECLVMVAGVAVDDIQILDFIEMMFRCISCIYSRYTRIESASQDSRQTRFFETVFIGPLPAVLIFGFIKRFVVGRI